MNDRPLTIRIAAPEDAGALQRLAALDSAPHPAGRVLLAELDGAPIAAVSLEAGTVIADPFRYSSDAVWMLMLRRRQLTRGGPDVASRPLRLRLVSDLAN